MNGPVVILTALDLEYQAVRATMTDLRLQQHPAGTRFEVGRIGQGACRAALALVGKGNHPAAVLAERAIAEFAPAAVMFVGVAGALRPSIALGDVVVATHVYAYHGGTSEDDGLRARPRVWEISHGPDQIARHLGRAGDWTRKLPPGSAAPQVHFGPIAAGEIVQDSIISGHARWIREHYNDALAIEMEAGGVAQAGHLNNSLPVIVVRGISDRADGTKAASDGVRWQPRAAANAAAFAACLAPQLVLGNQAARSGGTGQMARSGEMGRQTTNIATGNARVGVQAGHVTGGIRIAPQSEPISLEMELASFRKQLRQACIQGRLDQSTCLAAKAELDAATGSLATKTEQSANTLMVALKKLRGLIADVAELAAHLAVIISAAKGMS
jgi:adenosylhomocysteine nucleosidase